MIKEIWLFLVRNSFRFPRLPIYIIQITLVCLCAHIFFFFFNFIVELVFVLLLVYFVIFFFTLLCGKLCIFSRIFFYKSFQSLCFEVGKKKKTNLIFAFNCIIAFIMFNYCNIVQEKNEKKFLLTTTKEKNTTFNNIINGIYWL